MSQSKSYNAKPVGRHGLPSVIKRRTFFTGPEAAKLISRLTDQPCSADDLKDLVTRGFQPSVRFTGRCLLPLARTVINRSTALTAAQLQAHNSGAYKDQLAELNGQSFLLRGLKDPLLLCPDDWVWPVDAYDSLELGWGEVSSLMADCITNPRVINAAELEEHPSSTSPIKLRENWEELLQGFAWGSEFLKDELVEEMLRIYDDVRHFTFHETDKPPAHDDFTTTRLITAASLGSAKLEVGFSWFAISKLEHELKPPKDASNERADQVTLGEWPMNTKSFNKWQEFMHRVVIAELGDKFDPSNKQETIRTLINRVERKEKEGNIQPLSNFPSNRWIINNLF